MTSLQSPFRFLAACILSLVFAGMAPAAPKASIGIKKLDFGTVKRGDIAEKTVPIRNDGDAPFTILKVNSSCPCVQVETPAPEKATVGAGIVYELPVRYDTKDRIGPQGAVIAIMTDDPANPALTLDVTAFVEALVVVRPPNGILWGYVARGNKINKSFEIAPGNAKNDIELIDIRVTHPGVRVAAEKSVRNGENTIQATFTVAPDVPLGPLDGKIEARVRVAGEEAAISAPFHGDVIGDLLVSPPSIVSPKTAYTLGQQISEITVQASDKAAAPPKLLSALTVGAVKAAIIKTGNPAVQKVAVLAGDNVGAGPQTGTVYIMTDSKDQPVTAVPVYFRMDAAIRAEPASVPLKAGASQRVALRPAAGDRLKIMNIGFEEDVLSVKVVEPEQRGPDTPAALEISALSPAKPDRLGSIVIVETNAPGGSRVYIPVVIVAE